jgi:hypothetical protein
MRSARGTHHSATLDHQASGRSAGVRIRRWIATELFGSASQMAGASSMIVWYARLNRSRLSGRVIAESALSACASNVGLL